MNKLLSFSVAVAIGVAATAGVAQAASPDGTPGMALLAAHVSSSGAIINGAGATGASKLLTGQYEVDFNRDVSACFYTAASFSNTVAIDVEPRSGNVNGVFVVFTTLGTMAADPANTDSEFYMQVFCAR